MTLTFQNFRFRYFVPLILLILIFSNSSHTSFVIAQEADDKTEAVVETIFSNLTPKERIGQLFMVSFDGTNVDTDTDIARLIQTYRIGGVVISAANQNFVNNATTPNQVLSLTNALQNLAQETPITTTTALTTTAAFTSSVESPSPIPLFIGVQQEGDGYPHTQIRGGLMTLPSQMALGATWQPENARLIGEVVGRELALLGVNMLFGPSLDVLDNPRPERGGSLGTRTFGGHPFWVAEMGQAYIKGVHQGSSNQVLTIATHFPGFGSSDREIDQGVPTILKSLEDLRQTELPPFFRVMHIDSAEPAGLTDGVMTAHIRYQGLQGNVPISIDARNLPALLVSKEVAPWREAGGLVVSAPLGVPAALEGVAINNNVFPARRLAQDAFLAGSDILQTTDFGFGDNSNSEFANITDALNFFLERYTNDPNFQVAVDRSVKNILRAKIKIFGNDLLTIDAQKPQNNLALLNDVMIDLSQIAQDGITLITPIRRDRLSPLPSPPRAEENILIFVDDRTAQDCPNCPPFTLIQTNALQEIILQQFGPQATGQISPERITSLGFSDLRQALTQPTSDEGQDIIAQLEAADWLIFAMLDINSEVYLSSGVVRDLLRNRFDSLRNKNLVLFAFNAPYFLDETEISQLTAYYAFYSKGRDYLTAAARLLFQQFEPVGASPVGIPAIDPLDLSPDPNQTIQLQPVHWIDTNGNITPIESQVEPVTTLDLEIGEGVRFRTNVIVDRNGNPVPDGTLVNFFRVYPQENLPLEPVTAPTIKGVAEITIIKERETFLQVRASSDLAVQAVPFNIGPGIIDTPTPTSTPTALPTNTPQPTPPPTRTPRPTQTPVPTPEPTPTPMIGLGPGSSLLRPVDVIDLVYTLLGIMVIGGIAFTLGGDRFSLEERVRPALVAIALGLVGYICYTIAAIAFDDSIYMRSLIERNANGHWVAPLISLLFAVMGVIAWFLKPGRVFKIKEPQITLDTSKE